MGIEVCAVFAPRPEHEFWRDDYIRLLRAQRHSALAAGHSHRVVTDGAIGPGLDTLQCKLPASLMPAMIAGVLRRLDKPINGDIIFVDCDVLIARDCGPVFQRWSFDIGLTYRDDERAPINNGVMYVRGAKVARARAFYTKALEICGDHWGGDQEAISEAAAPVAHVDTNGERSGATIRFLSSKYFAAVPKVRLARHDSYTVHFKGATKEWMIDYAREYCGYKG